MGQLRFTTKIIGILLFFAFLTPPASGMKIIDCVKRMYWEALGYLPEASNFTPEEWAHVAKKQRLDGPTLDRIRSTPDHAERFQTYYRLKHFLINAPETFYPRLSHYLRQIMYSSEIPDAHRLTHVRHWKPFRARFASRRTVLRLTLADNNLSLGGREFEALVSQLDTLPQVDFGLVPSQLLEYGDQLALKYAVNNWEHVRKKFQTYVEKTGNSYPVTEQGFREHLAIVTRRFLQANDAPAGMTEMRRDFTDRITTGYMLSNFRTMYALMHVDWPARRARVTAQAESFLNVRDIAPKTLREVYLNLILETWFGKSHPVALGAASLKLSLREWVDGELEALQNWQDPKVELPAAEVAATTEEEKGPPAGMSSGDVDDGDPEPDPKPPVPAKQPKRRHLPKAVTAQSPAVEIPPTWVPPELSPAQIAYLRGGSWRSELANKRGFRLQSLLAVAEALLGPPRRSGGHVIFSCPLPESPILVFTTSGRGASDPVYVVNVRKLISRLIRLYPSLGIEDERWTH